MNYLLFSQDQEQPIKWFTKFDKEEIKTEIINHLKEHKTDVLEFCKEYSKKELKRYLGYNIIDFYQNNKEVPSKVILRGGKEYFKPLVN
jgi:hypothetical protein